MRSVLAGLALVLALAGCSGVEGAAQEGAVEGALEGLGKATFEQSLDITLQEDFSCRAKPASGDDHQVDCSGQTKEGKKAIIKGTVTSIDVGKGVVRGKLSLTFDGKDLGEMDCVGVC